MSQKVILGKTKLALSSHLVPLTNKKACCGNMSDQAKSRLNQSSNS